MGELISLDEPQRWAAALDKVSAFDCYHLAAYQRICCAGGAAKAYLYVYEIENDLVALPVLINAPAGFDWSADSVIDASSAYGYPGPLLGLNTQPTDALFKAFLDDLRETLEGENVVSFFARLHPLLTPRGMFGEHERQIGKTVWIDLTKPLDQQRSDCRKSHRYELRKSLRNGVTVFHDDEFVSLEQFIAIYEQRMTVLNANDSYYFSHEYYHQLRDELGSTLKLVHAQLDGQIIASSMFLLSQHGIQYHLSGTLDGYAKYSPTRVILEAMREWGTERDYKWLHLGGGVNGAEDSLFKFKSGFATSHAEYRIGRIVVDDERYAQLSALRNEASAEPADANFFPVYRA